MVDQAFKKGDIVAIQGSVEWQHDGKVYIKLIDHQNAHIECGKVTMVTPKFDIGDDVITDTGTRYTIAAIYRDFAWVFSDVEGFDTIELSTLVRPDPEPAPDFKNTEEDSTDAAVPDDAGEGK